MEHLAAVFAPDALLSVLIGTVSGVVIGAMPGLTATMAVGLLVPFTYTMDPVLGLMLLGGIYCGAMYGGSIPAILLNTPGTPAAVATALEGYPMSRQGRGRLALKISVIASFVGGTFSTLILLMFAPVLARQALNFGPPETFLLALMGLAGIVSIADEDNSLIKALIAGLRCRGDRHVIDALRRHGVVALHQTDGRLDGQVVRAGVPVHAFFAGAPEGGSHSVDEEDVRDLGHSASNFRE